jgi:serine/threonine-protein phosphatase 6 regulatory ankyrin repeat subunit B
MVHLQVVDTLLAAGADVNARTADGATALTVASQKGHRDVVALLNRKSARRRPGIRRAAHGEA